MKRMICALCAALLIAALFTACGEPEPAPTEAPTALPTAEPTSLPTEAPTPAQTDAPAPTSAPDGAQTARALIGQDAAQVLEALGEPQERSYASSCIGDGEDGEWYYEGFTVYTYRGTDGSERVEDVL